MERVSAFVSLYIFNKGERGLSTDILLDFVWWFREDFFSAPNHNGFLEVRLLIGRDSLDSIFYGEGPGLCLIIYGLAF
jgi:hypothetical protein